MNHYEVLDLGSRQSTTQALTSAELKQAYRNALLKYHPDKAKGQNGPPTPPASMTASPERHGVPSIDAIKSAYTVLSDPAARAAYDRELLSRHSRRPGKEPLGRTGGDTVDLDDLQYDEAASGWYKECRCGETRGYVVTEQQLEDEHARGGKEIVVGCIGCSLWLRIAFGILDEGGT